jgi:capsular exopolysaccharide synthesis family protein
MAEEQLDYGKLLRKSFKYWYLVMLSLLISVGLAYLYVQTRQPIYQSDTLLLIKDDKESGQLNEASFFKDLGIGSSVRNLENEKTILASTPLMKEVVEALDLQYQYIKLEPLKKWELYQNSPIRVASWEPLKQRWPDLYGVVSLQGTAEYRFEMAFGDLTQQFQGQFGKTLALPTGKLTLTYLGGDETEYPIAIRITSPWQRAHELKSILSIDLLGAESSILSLSFQDVARDRAQDVLLKLIEIYNEQTIESENQVFRNTIGLIEERLDLLNDELSETEQDVQHYKQRYSMTELSAEGSMLMTELEAYNKELSTSEVQLSILESIEDFLEQNKETFDFVPTNLSINNLTLTGQLNRFNELLSEQKRLAAELGPKHQDRILIEEQIGAMRETIIESIRSIKGDLLITRNASNNHKNRLETRLQSLPKRERELIEIERQKTVKENLYLYLLEKREESAISMAVTMAKGVVVEPPSLPGSPFSPRPKQILLIGIFLGLALPVGLILLIIQMDDKIYTKEEIEKLTDTPIASFLSMGKQGYPLVVKENSRSMLTEMFRLLRTNLVYMTPGQEMHTLLITSSMSGEGKSFIALNLGMTVALTGKKVVVVELDLRKPKQERYLGLKTFKKEGVVDYLVDPSIQVDQLIRPSEVHPDLFHISSGSKTPPNPGELILAPRLRELIKALKGTFDFIILDSPPVGMVADALQMKDLADATMYVVRSGQTRIGQLQIVEDIVRNGKLPKPFIVLNGIRLDAGLRYGRRYGYGYGYGYGYDYYQEDQDKKKWWHLFKKKNKRTSSKENGRAKVQQNKAKPKDAPKEVQEVE